MLPRKIESTAPEGERHRWRIVRLDTYEAVAGDILSADCDSGAVSMSVITNTIRHEDGRIEIVRETRTHNFGSNGIAIVGWVTR